MLTGESVPVIKNSLKPTEDFFDLENEEASKKITLFSGTKVIQARNTGGQSCTALVVRTGFVTTKGSLVRDILYPKPVNFKFYRESVYFVFAMALVALSGFAISFNKLKEDYTNTKDLIKRSLDLITIAVPPALPATMSVGVSFAIRRLRLVNIFCISPPRVNISGMLQIMVFDKTGTLTEDGLEVKGVVGCLGAKGDNGDPKFAMFTESIGQLLPQQLKDLSKYLLYNSVKLNEAMACCHSLTYVNGLLVGDPLDIEMFNSTNWLLDESRSLNGSVRPRDQNIAYELEICRRFDFESKLQRMCSIVKNTSDN
jgi:cation-transporting ATPase 13A2